MRKSPSDGQEIELKLAVPAQAVAAVRAAIVGRRDAGVPRHLLARYFDTAERTLARAQAALRLRLEDGVWIQTFKARGGDALTRTELECVRPDGQLALSAFDAQPRASILHALARADSSPDRGLMLQFETDFERVVTRVRRGETRIEIALDIGSIRTPARTLPICELEFECLAGPVEPMLKLARAWALRFHLWIDPASKAERGDRLAQGLTPRTPWVSKSPALAPGANARQRWAAMADEAIGQILASAAAVSAADPDPEHLHLLRVALRRLHALSDAGRIGAPVPAPALQRACGALCRRLGLGRDADVFRSVFQAPLAEAGCPAFAIEQPGLANAADILREAAAQRTLFGLLAWQCDLPLQAFPVDVDSALSGFARKRWRALWRAARQFGSLDDPARHRLRRRLRRLRYLLELGAVPGFGTPGRIARLAAAQDLIGLWADQRMAEQLLADAAPDQPGSCFARGWFAHRRAEIERHVADSLRRLCARRRRAR